jgi:(1->4)-alpha-D-glucan 1-alpha-D-glucosylmutase
MDRLIETAARHGGIEPEWVDIWGQRHRVPVETLHQLVAGSGFDVSSARALSEQLGDIERRETSRWLPPTVVVTASSAPTRIPWRDPARAPLSPVHSKLSLEDGRPLDGQGSDASGVWLPAALPTGYHRLTLAAAGTEQSVRLIVSPGRCHAPERLEGDGRGWGPAVQLYALRSSRNWGVGDFEDLARLAELSGREGAQMVGVNPLHALFPDDPERASPYSPSSRLFLNVLMIDVESVPELTESADLRQELGSGDLQARLERLRQLPMVDYGAVASLKLPALRQLYGVFRRRHRSSADSARGRDFARYLEWQGAALRRHALFEAIQASQRAADPAVWGWGAWPSPLQDPRSDASQRFAAEHEEAVEFHAYLQWEADRQLAAASARGEGAGLGLGLYLDLALGASPDGSEVWTAPEDYAQGVSIGSPPDDFNLRGQDWGLPPPVPRQMRQSGYARFRETLQANMRRAGAIRIDHVMQLMRLFWVPHGAEPTAGAYVRYPLRDLLGVLALESQRNQCLVVGEDLGTVPDEVRRALPAAGVLCYRVLYFEREQDGSFKAPERYPRDALATVSNHDLPTFAGYWSARDIDTRERVGAFPTEDWPAEQRRQRAEDRSRLLRALEGRGLLQPPPVSPDPPPATGSHLSPAVHRYLAQSPAKLMTVQLEDVTGQLDQVNLPGTTEQAHPNWRRKLEISLEELPEDARFRTMVNAVRERTPSGEA